VSHSIAHRRPVRVRAGSVRGAAAIPRAAARGGSGRGSRTGVVGAFRRRSILAALVAYVLVGAFIGLATWKLTETAVETIQAPEAMPLVEPHADSVAAPTSAFRGPHVDPSLLAVLEQQAASDGFVGLFVRNLTTGAEASVNPGRVFPAASLYKLPILVETVRQIRLGRIGADQLLVVQRAQLVPGSGVLQGRVGDSLTVRELLRLMISESDNIAATMLLDLIGLNNVNQTMQGLGLEATRLLDYRAQGASNGVGPYSTSPADMAALLDSIGTGRLVDQDTSDEALRLLGQKQASDLLADALPWNVKVAHKWGEIPGARHEVGIVYTPRFQYVVVVMTESMDPASSPGYIRGLSKAVYDFFDQGAGAGQAP
jgi:beta-lactamase class A